MPEIKKLKELKELFSLGLRDIGDRVYQQRLTQFSSDEVEHIVEARFESTTLRDSILKGIAKSLEK